MKKTFKKVSPVKNGRRRKGSMNTSSAHLIPPTATIPAPCERESFTNQLVNLVQEIAPHAVWKYKPSRNGVLRDSETFGNSVFLKVHRAARGDHSVLNRRFIWTAMRNKAFDDLRSSKRAQARNLDYAGQQQMEGDAGPAAALDAGSTDAELDIQVFAELRRLHGMTRDFHVLWTMIEEDLSIKEMAAIKCVSQECMKKRLQRAKLNLAPHIRHIRQRLIDAEQAALKR